MDLHALLCCLLDLLTGCLGLLLGFGFPVNMVVLRLMLLLVCCCLLYLLLLLAGYVLRILVVAVWCCGCFDYLCCFL